VHRAGAMGHHAFDQALLGIAARLAAGRAGPDGSAALDKVVDQRLQPFHWLHMGGVDRAFSDQVDRAAGEERVHLPARGEAPLATVKPTDEISCSAPGVLPAPFRHATG